MACTSSTVASAGTFTVLEKALPALSATVRTIEDGVMLALQVGRAFDRHTADDAILRFVDLRSREPEMLEQRESPARAELFGRPEALVGLLAEHPSRERALEIEHAGDCTLHLRQLGVGQALLFERAPVDVGSCKERVGARDVSDDLLHLSFAISEAAQCARNRLVDDLEVPSAGQLLELDQREVRLDSGRIAVHEQADGARGSKHGGLRVAVAVLFPET